VQGKALLVMCGVSQKRMRKHSRTPHRFVPQRGTLWEGGRPTCTVSLLATVRKLANALALQNMVDSWTKWFTIKY
ncbi:hypothetical protein, partial [Candidatus Magnetaquicoccus inordinatus]|uniref:hypothetical protein n=1 Tax=Candidatus Magnetaquicoccus inordinatus TaxID=2496818 RepID=UPI001D0E49EC